MPFSIAPNPAERNLLQFHLLPKVSYSNRFVLAGGLVILGLLIQILLVPQSPDAVLAISLGLIFAGNLLLLVRGYNSQPQSLGKKTTWEPTTLEKFQRIAQMERNVRKWDDTIFDISCIPGFAVFACLVAFAVVLLVSLSSNPEYGSWPLLFGADAAVLIIPHWITGMRRGWRPSVLCQQVKALETVVDIASNRVRGIGEIVPMLEMAGTAPNQVPVGTRLMIRYPKASKDFLGVQFQVNLNNVQGVNYPYLYAVIVAQKAFDLLLPNRLEKVRQICSGLTVEDDDKSAVEVIIIRQTTSKTSGYHTNRAAINRIVDCALTAGEEMVR